MQAPPRKTSPEPWTALAGAGALLVLAACTDPSADLQRRVTFLQDELDRARAELDAANGRLAAAAESAAPGASESETALRDQMKRSYETAAREFRAELQSRLGDAKMDFELYQPRIESFPHRSEFSVEAQIDGKPIQVKNIPVRAGYDGRWLFPSVSEVAGLIEQAKNAPASAQASTAPEAPAPPPRSGSRAADPGVAAPSPSNQTVVIQWGGGADASRPAPRESAPAPAERAPAPSPRDATPAPVMPSSRDVFIKF